MQTSHTPFNIDLPGNRESVLQSMLQAALSLLSTDYCAAISLNPIKGVFHKKLLSHDSAAKAPRRRQLPQWMAALALRCIEAKTAQLENLPRQSDSQSHDVLDTLDHLAAIPLFTKRKSQAIAVLFLGSTQPRPLSEEEQAGLGALIAQYEPLLEGAWMLGRYQAIIVAGQKVNLHLQDHQNVFRQLYEEISDVIDTSYFISLSVYQPQSRLFDHYRFYSGNYLHQKNGEYKGGCAYVLDNKRNLITFNYRHDKARRKDFPDFVLVDPNDKTPLPESMLFIPLLYNDEPLGVLSIQHPEAEAYDEEDVRILELLGNQVALALNNLRLFDYMKQINQSGDRFLHQLSQQRHLLKQVVNQIRAAAKADIVVLYPYVFDPHKPTEEGFDKNTAQDSGDYYHRSHTKDKVLADDMANLALIKALNTQIEETWAPDSHQLFKLLGGDPTKGRLGEFEKREKIASTAVLVLRIGDDMVGVLFINFRKQQNFDAFQKLLITNLAHFAAIAIKNQRDIRAHRGAEFKVLQEVDRGISSIFDLETVMGKILDLVKRHVRANESAIYLYDEATHSLKALAVNGEHQETYQGSVINIAEMEKIERKGLVTTSFLNGEPVLERDVRNNPAYQNVVSTTKSELDVPFIDPETGRSVGVLNLESTAEGAFNEGDRDFIVTFAGQAVLAIKNAQTYKRVERLSSSLTILPEIINRLILKKVSAEDSIRIILRKAYELVEADMGVLQLYETGLPTKSFIVKSEEPQVSEKIASIEPYSELFGIIKYVAEMKKSYLASDTEGNLYYQGSPEIKSELAVPLLDGEKLIGVLDLESTRRNAFTDEDKSMLELFARQAVLIIQGANRHIEVQDEAERDRKRLTLLQEAANELRSINEPESLDDAYDIVIKKISDFNNGEIVIRRYMPEDRALVLVRLATPFQMEPPPAISIDEGLNGQVFRDRQTIIIPDLDNPPPDTAKPIVDENVKTIIIVPLDYGNKYYGNIILSHRTVGIFKLSDKSLLEGLATQLAITLYRLELVQTVRETESRAKEKEVMSRVGDAALEITHKLGNRTGSITAGISFIRSKLKNAEAGPARLSDEIEKELDQIVSDITSIAEFSERLKEAVMEKPRSPQIVEGELLLPDLTSLARQYPNIHFAQIKILGSIGTVEVMVNEVADIINHLIINAIAAMPNGGTLTVQAHASSKELIIKVIDTGVGIRLEKQKRVFDLFYSTTGGFGFGLWRSKQLALLNGGDLTLDSTPGEGTTFNLHLPLSNKTSSFSI